MIRDIRAVFVLPAILAIAACCDEPEIEGAPDAPPADAPDATPSVDYDFSLPGPTPATRYCRILDRAAFGIARDPAAAYADDWCGYQGPGCDGLCAAYVGVPDPGTPYAEWFVECDPVARRLAGPTCRPE